MDSVPAHSTGYYPGPATGGNPNALLCVAGSIFSRVITAITVPMLPNERESSPPLTEQEFEKALLDIPALGEDEQA